MPNPKNKKPTGRVPEFVKEEPIAASILSKLNMDAIRTNPSPLDGNLPSVGLGTYQKIKNNEDIILTSPDIELAIQIITSSIISPNNSLQDTISYTAPDIKIPGALKQTILDRIRQQMETEYELNVKLPTILRETLFTKGAYIEVIIPEASLDDIISQYNYKDRIAVESYLGNSLKPTYDFLGQGNDKVDVLVSREDSNTMSFVKFNTTGLATNPANIPSNGSKGIISVTQEDLGIEITDNFKILNLKDTLIKHAQYASRKKVYRNGLATEDKKEEKVNLNHFFRISSSYKQQDYIEVTTRDDSSRESLGKPLVIKLPVEATIPVHVVNDPSKHLGYFVLLDENGTPVSGGATLTDDEVKYYSVSNMENDSKLNMIKRATQALTGMISPDLKIDNLEDIYNKIVEDLIKKKLKSGQFGDLADIKESADIFRTMFVRALRSQQTKILFLPSELVAYYAFEYRENGTGKSWMEKAAVFYSIKSILMFARIMAYLKNSTATTEVSVTLDEKDPNPRSTMELYMSEFLKTRQNMLPLGVMRPDDLVEWIQKVGVRFKWSGNPGIPEMSVDTSQTNTNYNVPDDELDNTITKNIYMTFGLTPEIVEAGYSTDFATTVIAKNILFAKRIARLQNTFNKLLTDHVRKLVINDLMLINDLKNIINKDMGEIKKFLNKIKTEEEQEIKKLKPNEICDYVIDAFLNEISVYLPSPEPPQNENIKTQYENYKSMLEDVIGNMLSNTYFTNEYFGAVGDKVEGLKTMYIGAILMKWMQENNFMPELNDIVTKDDEGNFVFNVFEQIELFAESLGEAYAPFIKKRMKAKNKLDQKIQKADEQANASTDSSSSTDTDTSTDTEENTDTENTEENPENTEETPENPEEGGEGGEGGDTGDMGDMGADMDMGDMGLDDGTGESKPGPKGNVKDPETIKLEQELIKARIEKEKANIVKARAEAAKQQAQANMEPTYTKDNIEKFEDTNVQKEDEQETPEEEPTEAPEGEQEGQEAGQETEGNQEENQEAQEPEQNEEENAEEENQTNEAFTLKRTIRRIV